MSSIVPRCATPADVTRNSPAYLPPQELRLPLSDCLPPVGRAHMTAVSTSRGAPTPKPNFPEQPCSRSFTTAVFRLPPAQPMDGDTDPWEAERKGFKRSIFADCESGVSETCKFTPAEQERLIRFRSRLVDCEEELATLCALLTDNNSTTSGLPWLRETHRNRLKSHVFSAEDATRDLCNARLLGRLRDYVAFVDHALADRLDSAPGCSHYLASRSTSQVAGVPFPATLGSHRPYTPSALSAMHETSSPSRSVSCDAGSHAGAATPRSARLPPEGASFEPWPSDRTSRQAFMASGPMEGLSRTPGFRSFGI
mmetsp:Transcript_58911/g.164593  ORF Transcript_58911/g.164593 Transcript_58911/m.164593 type:complete len:311 (-) Transcript_58911:120-1052(-)